MNHTHPASAQPGAWAPFAPAAPLAAGGDDGPMQLHLSAPVVLQRVAAMVDAGARREAIAVLNLAQEALTHQPTPSASRLFTALRAWEGSVVGIDMAEEALHDGGEVEELMHWWSAEQQARQAALGAAQP